jgi:hypothetical protein
LPCRVEIHTSVHSWLDRCRSSLRASRRRSDTGCLRSSGPAKDQTRTAQFSRNPLTDRPAVGASNSRTLVLRNDR